MPLHKYSSNTLNSSFLVESIVLNNALYYTLTIFYWEYLTKSIFENIGCEDMIWTNWGFEQNFFSLAPNSETPTSLFVLAYTVDKRKSGNKNVHNSYLPPVLMVFSWDTAKWHYEFFRFNPVHQCRHFHHELQVQHRIGRQWNQFVHNSVRHCAWYYFFWTKILDICLCQRARKLQSDM